MLTRDRKRTMQLEGQFQSLYLRAFQEAQAIVVSRAQTRDTGLPIWSKMPFGLASYVTFVFHKASRLVSLVLQHQRAREESQRLLAEQIREELLDIINYCGFAIAYIDLEVEDATSDNSSGK